jgi:hypothetical protein
MPWNLYCFPSWSNCMVNSLKSMRMGSKVLSHSAPHNVTTTHVDRKHMRFQVVFTNLETHIFTTPSTFHGPAIGNHDLKIIDCPDIAISFLGNVAMNKIMGASTINKNDDLHMLDVTNYLEALGSREANERI